jgi:hypothetical protein
VSHIHEEREYGFQKQTCVPLEVAAVILGITLASTYAQAASQPIKATAAHHKVLAGPYVTNFSANATTMKAALVGDDNTHHLVIGLNRENMNTLLNGDVFTLPPGMLSHLDDDSDVVLLFAETDAEL